MSAMYARRCTCVWVAVKELDLSCFIGESLLFVIYTHYGNPKPYVPYVSSFRGNLRQVP